MPPFSNFSDHSQNPPRLQIGQALWGMEHLPFGGPLEWTLEAKIARVKAARFQHLECWLGTPEQQEQTPPLLREHELEFALGHRPMSVMQTLETVQIAIDLGARWVLCQPATASHSLAEVVGIVRAGSELAARYGVCYFVETHRNNFTETIPQTLQLIEAVPDIALTADFSHFVVCGEYYGAAGEDFIERIRPIIERVAHVHGRVSNGEQIQVDVGKGQTAPARFFVEIWTEIFKTWRGKAKPGDILPFSPELGPPRYAITTPDGKEISDRWTQALVMRDLALEAWKLSDE